MKLKVCGLNNPENINELADLNPDYLGFIFYPDSKRFVAKNVTREVLTKIVPTIQKVGVFVNEQIDMLKLIYQRYNLDVVQLHGDEPSHYCAKLYLQRIPVIKAFSLDEAFNFRQLEEYAPFCKYFLFDTKGKLKGGNGKKFNWEILKNYDLRIPFFLSGGIDLHDAERLAQLDYLMLYGVDINSRFEIKPGLKDVQKIEKFKQKLQMNKELNYENRSR